MTGGAPLRRNNIELSKNAGEAETVLGFPTLFFPANVLVRKALLRKLPEKLVKFSWRVHF